MRKMNYTKDLALLLNVRYILIFTLITLLVKYVVAKCSRNSRWVNFSKKLPGPYAYPIIGNSLNFLFAPKDGLGALLCQYMFTYGSTIRLWIGKNLVVLLSDVDDVEIVLSNSNCLGKSEMVEVFHELFGNSLIIAEPVAVWKQKRKKLQPFFVKHSLQNRIPVMNEQIYKYIEKLKMVGLVDGPEFDCENIMNDISFDTITKTHLNFVINDQDRKDLNNIHKIDSAFEILSLKMFCSWLPIQPLWDLMFPTNLNGSKRMFANFVDQILKYNRESEKLTKTSIVNGSLKSETFVQSYFRTLDKLQEEIGDEDLTYSEILLLIIAGKETTGITMAFCFLAIAALPEIQEKLYQEIYKVFGEDERPANKSDLDRLSYLDQVIKETQRIFTIIPTIMRNVQKDTKIGAHTYPAGTTIMINIAGIHHNPKLYPNPYSFNPDNFAPEAVKTRHRYSFLPFSAGARNCIGKEYSELSMKLRLIAFLRTFTFHTTIKIDDIKLKPGLLERSSTGFPISIKRRTKLSK